MRLSTRLPLTYRWLAGKVSEVDQSGGSVIKLVHGLYHLTVRLGYGSRDLADEFQAYLREKIPANLCLAMEVYFEIKAALRICAKPYFNAMNERLMVAAGKPCGTTTSSLRVAQAICRIGERIHVGHWEAANIARVGLHCGHVNIQYCRLIIS